MDNMEIGANLRLHQYYSYRYTYIQSMVPHNMVCDNVTNNSIGTCQGQTGIIFQTSKLYFGRSGELNFKKVLNT